MFDLKEFRAVVITVSDVERSLAFYRDLLGFKLSGQTRAETAAGTLYHLDAGRGHVIQLFHPDSPAKPSGWLPDDLQTGLRHVGFKVRDTDASTAQMKAAGVPFTLDPLDANGGVRISFFKDPDGTLLEFVQGELNHDVNGPAAGSLPPFAPDGDEVVFDHVAITVSNIDDALAFYRDRLGCPVIGELHFNDERGFLITNVKAGTAVLELFSFSKPTLANPWSPDMAVLGLKHVVFEVGDVAAGLSEVGVKLLREPDSGAGLVAGPDGTAFEVAAYQP